MNNASPTLADDLLDGAKEIAEFVFGSADSAVVRRVYHLAATGQLPGVSKMGARLIGRKSKLMTLGAA